MTHLHFEFQIYCFKHPLIVVPLMFLFCVFPLTGHAQETIRFNSASPMTRDTLKCTSPTTDPATWVITKRAVFDENSQPINSYISALLNRLQDSTGLGVPVTLEEFCQILEDDTASIVYADMLVKYATPQSIEIQNKDHENLSKVVLRDDHQQAGLSFQQTHDSLLAAVQAHYHVHRKDIVAILMWESKLGKFSGNYQIFNVFMGQILFLGLAYDYAIKKMTAQGDTSLFDEVSEIRAQQNRLKRIRKRAVENLSILLRVAKESGTNPLSYRGSWGGAIGYPQFMPFRLNLAVDGDNNAEINLYTWPDAIHSVANYLRNFNYDSSMSKRRRAIYRYNPMKSYVDGVINYADTVWTMFEKDKIEQ